MEQLEGNVKAAFFTLTEQQVKKLNKASDTPLPYPFYMYKQPLAGITD